MPTKHLYLIFTAGLTLISSLHAQSSDELLERLRLTAVTTALDAPGSGPFHLKASVQLDAQYQRPAEQGTVEVWSAGPDSQRVDYDFPSYRGSVLRTPAGQYRSAQEGKPPFLIADLLDQLLHPLSLSVGATRKATLGKRDFGKISLDCITLTSPETKPPKLYTAPPVTYCLAPANSDLRITFAPAGRTATRDNIGAFRTLRPASDISLAFTGRPAAHAHIELLQGQATPYPQSSDSTGLTLIPNPTANLSGSVVAGRILRKENPIYPEPAKREHISGAVLLHAIIGIDGKITDLEVIGSPDPLLSNAALDAVKRWTYEPYLLNGKPTEVDTTITVQFNFGPA